MSEKKLRLLAAALCGLAALVWSIVTALQATRGLSPWLVLINLICALIWWIACGVQIVRYKTRK